jgi:hypothetical protein
MDVEFETIAQELADAQAALNRLRTLLRSAGDGQLLQYIHVAHENLLLIRGTLPGLERRRDRGEQLGNPPDYRQHIRQARRWLIAEDSRQESESDPQGPLEGRA